MAATTGTNPIDNLTYDWLTVLRSRAEGINAYEKSMKDVQQQNSTECVEMFRKPHELDIKQVQEIKAHMAQMMQKKGF